jgi:hypothetical protein
MVNGQFSIASCHLRMRLRRGIFKKRLREAPSGMTTGNWTLIGDHFFKSGSRSLVDVAGAPGLFGTALTTIGLAAQLIALGPVFGGDTAIRANTRILGR